VDYTGRNISMVLNIIKSMVPFKASTILFIVANPVDLITSIAQELSGLPRRQVFGSGTFPDSIRLRGLVANELEVSVTLISFLWSFPMLIMD
jgi:L-lactate dehydrogenase